MAFFLSYFVLSFSSQYWSFFMLEDFLKQLLALDWDSQLGVIALENSDGLLVIWFPLEDACQSLKCAHALFI